jgi:glycosyltransferase involved in cell wall biosynthesis
MPSLSIVVPTKNSSSTLGQALHSILCQSIPPLEVVIVDASSTDGTLDIVESFSLSLNIVKVLDSCDGISSAFNAGVLAAKGDIIAILNSDDFYLHDRVFESVCSAIPECNSIYCASISYAGKVYCSSPGKIVKGMYVRHPTCFVPRSVYAKVGLFEKKFSIAMDYHFIMRCRLEGVVFTVSSDCIVHMRPGGASSNWSKAFWEEFIVKVVLHRPILPALLHLIQSFTIRTFLAPLSLKA